jgi:hypothetical protein
MEGASGTRDEFCVTSVTTASTRFDSSKAPRLQKEQVRRPGQHMPHSGNERKIPQNIIVHRLAKPVL